MIKFKRRLSLKQYMPKKPIKRGYKVWMRCDSSGFACEFQIYTGKTEEVERNLGERVIRNLSQKLLGKNHVLFFDNYFTSYDLLKHLETQNITACGTVNMSRKKLPKNLLGGQKMKQETLTGVLACDIACIKWKDKRIVHILATLDEATKSCEIEKKEKDGKKIKIACPKAVIRIWKNYNRNMGYVDHFDQLKSMYDIDRKSKKWWHRIFFLFFFI
ncbi:piggyBac transposable element-derived protein 4 [Trichonephila inaurata madagascariensis]|uniref:PiggyBac transposable element-derived protein 4 n=1 Tax=Trichonephila inaurata madagascariensis TaxID=2747483 RepID=A0A8X6XCP2_9ARAC|nr:piggyBac transposable element-derived protein 4 [Trichonephila inaurata madagascariensis]